MSPVVAGSTFIRPHLNLGYGNDRPDGVNSLPELIAFNAKHNPDHIFGLQTRAGEGAPPCEITFEQLQLSVENASAWLVDTGATTGRTRREQVVQPVAILLGSDIGIYIYMAALLRIGTPVLCLSARLTPVAIAHLLKKTKPSCMLVNAQVARAAKETLALLHAETEPTVIPTFLDALSYEDLLSSEHPSLKGLAIPPVYTEFLYDDLDAVILHSSGTTGLPKPIFHAHAYLLVYAACHRLPEQKEAFRFNVSTLPLYHGFGLLAPSLSLSIGMPFVLPPASVIPTARSTLAALQNTGARFMLSVPSILEDILKFPGGSGLETLKTLDFIAIGGAPMKENVGEELVAHGVNLLNHWGATEIGAIAPVERIPPGYDWHYLRPRSDMGLTFNQVEDAGRTYRLTGKAPGWKVPYVVQDFLEAHPHDNKQFKILGRADDLMVLATGEKIRPANMERAVAEHPDVKDVLAFGDGQLSLGLLVELAAGKAQPDLAIPENHEALLASLDPYLERGNSFTDKHGKVTREMIVFTREETKRLIRTDKGSLARKANYAAFEEEIKACYERADSLKAVPFPLPGVDGGSALLGAIRGLVREITGIEDFGDTREGDATDFFEAGMDSLQASRLRRAILTGLRVTPGLAKPVEDLEPDFCFQNSSVEKIYGATVRVMEGTYFDEDAGVTRLGKMEEMFKVFREELVGYAEEAAEARRMRGLNKAGGEGGAVVLLTGSTGSLGCMLVARLASDPTVSKVICLNRPQPVGSVGVRERQLQAMEKRGAAVDPKDWEKVVLHEAEVSRPDFGLGDAEFAALLDVTHIIHNAWPVNFNRNLSSFASHVKGLCNLVRLSILSAGRRSSDSEPTRLLFASSIAVVGRFPLLNPQGPLEVPEIALDAVNTAEFGYPEAKWVCERVLMAAAEMYGATDALLKTSSVRIGQMTGPEGSGAWNEMEHFPIIVRTAQNLKALPSLQGSLSWIPVNRAGNVITELLFSKGFKPFYHMENPSRQSWAGLLDNLASILGGSEAPLPLIPFPEWLDRVRALGDDPARNAAFKVLSFLEHDFVRMASGPVILRTAESKGDSATMVNSTAVDRKHLEEYVAYWRRIGVLG